MHISQRSLLLAACFMALSACAPEGSPPVDTASDGIDKKLGPVDTDGDGVPAKTDCDDNNAAVGKVLYFNDFSSDTGYFHTAKSWGPWAYDLGAGIVSNVKGGQQAYLGGSEGWGDTVTYAKLSANGADSGCKDDCGTTDRFRAGIVARMTPDSNQNEGFHGYRCAVANNSGADCIDPGPFLQLAAFLDSDEDDINSECTTGCPANTSFDQLDRAERTTDTNLLNGDNALLTFWTVGNSLVCEFDGENGEHVVTKSVDAQFDSGGVALSTLNAHGEFDWIKVCEASQSPATDDDGDGVPSSTDCDDANPKVGALLYDNNFSDDTGYFQNSPNLSGPWTYGNGHVSNGKGGQQAYLGDDEDWTNTVTYLTVSAHDSESGCSGCDYTERYRAGILARMSADLDQDEGFHGYRCAISRNEEKDCATAGPFVQIAAFLDGPEDNVNSECTTGCPPNPTFDQLARVERNEATEFLTGDSVQLTFWAYNDKLVCDLKGADGNHFVAKATDSRFSSGGTGLSSLNSIGDYDRIRVCKALGAP